MNDTEIRLLIFGLLYISLVITVINIGYTVITYFRPKWSKPTVLVVVATCTVLIAHAILIHYR